jgi:PAS domain S-box-containing protein
MSIIVDCGGPIVRQDDDYPMVKMTEPLKNDNATVTVESDINERAAFLEGILESATLHAIVTEDLGGTVLSWNEGARRIYDYTAEEMIRRQSSRILYTQEDIASGRVDTLFSTARQTGAAEGIFEHVKKDGQRLTTLVVVTLLRDGRDTPLGLLSISKDITEQAKCHQQLRHSNEELEERYGKIEQANRLTIEFLADMVHELRTPLNSIIGFAELLLDGKAGPVIASQHEFLGDILSSGRLLLQLINDTFDLIQVESAFMEFFPQPVDLTAIGIEVCRSLESLAARKHIEITSEVDPSLSGIEIDPARLKQVLRNLLSSVLKFATEAGEVLLRLKPDGPDRFIIEIEGTDAGIGNDDIRRLLQTVEQPRGLNIHKRQGTALSLAVAKRIVETQGGEMRIRTTPGQGTILWARLARKFNRGEQGTGPDSECALPAEGAPAVLVIDPDAKDRASLVKMLSEESCQPIPAAAGAEALEHISKKTFAVITLDILLPDALQLLKTIRKSVLNRNTPVLGVSIIDREPNAEFRAYDWLVKPVGRERLLQAVRDAQSDAAKARVLVVDDDPSSLKLARHALSGEGYRVICASEGEEALRLVETDGPAAIVLDLVRNGIDGFEFLRRLRKSGERIPVIIWSGKSFTPDERDRLLRNVNKIVQKGDGGTKEIIEELKAALLGSASLPR